MRRYQDFLNPLCSWTTLDLFVVRRAILGALCSELGRLRGTLLDIGCGYMPYRSLVLASPSQVVKYIGLDLWGTTYKRPDLTWDGETIPLLEKSIDCALATELFDHCPDPERVMREAFRVLRPGGLLFFTVPFLWPLHDVPKDEYRLTPFALERCLRRAGFDAITLKGLGGWDASLAQMIGLWVRRRPLSSRKRAILSRLAVPLVRYLSAWDTAPTEFVEGSMITGISGTAIKPGR